MITRIALGVIAGSWLAMSLPTGEPGISRGDRGAGPADTLAMRRVLDFARVTAIAVDPRGGVLVADAMEGRVVRVDASGRRTGVAAQGDRMAPAGLDATNGLVLVVADAPAGAVLRFAADGRFLESRPIAATRDGSATSYDRRDVSIRDTESGRPVGVVETGDGRIFVADAASGSLMVFDRGHRLMRQVPALDGSEVRILPVGLARVGESFWLADGARPGILVFDAFLNEVRSIRFPDGSAPVAIAGTDDAAWILAGEHLLCYGRDGALEADLVLSGPVRPVAVAVSEDRIWVADRTGLFVAGRPDIRH